MQRPELNDSTGKYQCPTGYVACNSQLFDKPGGEEHVICKQNNSAEETECPITDLKFSLENVDARLYEEITVTNGDQNDKSIWISRKVDGHGIERTSVSPNKPCKDRIRYNAAPNQQFWFGEMRRKYRDCGVAGVHE